MLAEAGLTGINVLEAAGKAGADSITHCSLVEEVAWVCASTSLIPAVNKLATLPLLFAGTEEQKQRRAWPSIADGSAMASYCLTEPGSGSDAAAMRPGPSATATTTSSTAPSGSSPAGRWASLRLLRRHRP